MPLRLTGTTDVQRTLFNLSPLTPLEVWRKFYFDTVEPTGNAANNADPDGDGVANLMEYVTGQNPTAAPPDLRDWVPDDDLSHSVIDAVAALPSTTSRSTAAAPATPNTRPP